MKPAKIRYSLKNARAFQAHPADGLPAADTITVWPGQSMPTMAA